MRLTLVIGTSQLYTGRPPLFFLKLDDLFQPNFQCAGTARGGPGRDEPDIFFHKCKPLRVFQVGNQEIPLRPRDLLLTERAHQPSKIGLTVGGNNGTHPAVTLEKTSSMTLTKVTLLLMSARATLQRV